MLGRKVREPKEETTTLGLAVRDGDHVFGVAHIFASFNHTFIHVTDFSGRETMVCITSGMKELRITPLHIKLRATGGSKTKTPSSGAQAALKALARSGMKIGRCYPIPADRTQRKCGRRGRML
ncbi:hypothetical protein ES288_A04G080200v1 [Gossypium darwinii]|uniref:Ribosomal protein S11 n=1 Tax=Gossypium darwinii TaxID=34276 RepID=A0A5D2GVF9_GOSDA|nr:hypothetical protein ES288_A04G080200v1 [Gossypium darwinii]